MNVNWYWLIQIYLINSLLNSPFQKKAIYTDNKAIGWWLVAIRSINRISSQWTTFNWIAIIVCIESESKSIEWIVFCWKKEDITPNRCFPSGNKMIGWQRIGIDWNESVKMSQIDRFYRKTQDSISLNLNKSLFNFFFGGGFESMFFQWTISINIITYNLKYDFHEICKILN